MLEQPMKYATGFVVLAGAIEVAACTQSKAQSLAPAASGDKSSQALEHTSMVLEQADAFRSRAEAVTLADQLAMGAADSEQGSRMAYASGRVRLRAYRTFHVAGDVRETIEQYRGVEKSSDEEERCRVRFHPISGHGLSICDIFNVNRRFAPFLHTRDP